MKISRVDVRFFPSFNRDYEARARGNRDRPAWDVGEPWYPFVRVPIDGEITAIVGANESGKSQLLTALKAVLTGEPIRRGDFCRYSELYSVKAGELRLPYFGGEFHIQESDDVSAIPALVGAKTFDLFRLGDAPPFLVESLPNFERLSLASTSPMTSTGACNGFTVSSGSMIQLSQECPVSRSCGSNFSSFGSTTDWPIRTMRKVIPLQAFFRSRRSQFANPTSELRRRPPTIALVAVWGDD